MPGLPEDATAFALAAGAGVLAYFLFYKLLERRRDKSCLHDPIVVKSGHDWYAEPWTQRGYFCSMCEQPLQACYTCALCRIRVDEPSCLHTASQALSCKVNAKTTTSARLRHHWVLGNLEPDDFCVVCGEPCGEEIGLTDFRCAWCSRAVHTDCKRQLEEDCDGGVARRSLIPPNAVSARKAGSRNQKQMVIETVVPPADVEDFRPVIVITNPKSGSGAGDIIAKAFRNVLHPIQIVDVTKANMRRTLRWLEDHPDIEARILIAGGDGTISLVLDDIDELSRPPAVAVIPIGTGNDLSRVLCWGKASDGRDAPLQVLSNIQAAEEQLIDRWNVLIEPTRKLGVRSSSSRLSMTNYVSIGVDARVTFSMQSTRSSLPRAMSSRLLNKLLFFTYGTKDVFERACRGLNQKIELRVDDELIELPDIEGLIFLNIPSWGAGVNVWNLDGEASMPQYVDDGLFEVFAVRSSFHIAQLQVGLSSPIRLCQGRRATLRVLQGALPMQSDGEAWMQKTATITISHKCQSLVLRAPPPFTPADNE